MKPNGQTTKLDNYYQQVQEIMAVRRQKPLFFIDISVPRNLDPQIGQIENAYRPITKPYRVRD